MKSRKFSFKKDEIIKLDLAGDTPAGFISLEKDVRHNYKKVPYPIKDSSIDLIMASRVVEKINPADGGFIKFMNELWRVLKYGSQLMISTPYAGSALYWGDPTNINGCNASTWFYFDPEHPTGYYQRYKPKPWKIEQTFFVADGIMEVLLTKRHEKKK